MMFLARGLVGAEVGAAPAYAHAASKGQEDQAGYDNQANRKVKIRL